MQKNTKLTPENIAECKVVRSLLFKEKDRSGMTHATLAKMIGKSPKLISAIVNCRTRVTIDVARSLAKVFGVPLSEILPWTETLGPDKDTAAFSTVIEDLRDLTPENREIAIRMIKNLIDSQAGS